MIDSVGADAMRWHFHRREPRPTAERVRVEIVDGGREQLPRHALEHVRVLRAVRQHRRLRSGARKSPSRTARCSTTGSSRCSTDSRRRDAPALDDYDLTRGARAIEHFVDQLTNWYVRRNRRRFWKAASGDDKRAAYHTLYECLDVVTRLWRRSRRSWPRSCTRTSSAPALRGAPDSVHMCDWPEPDRRAARPRARSVEMEVVLRVVELGRAARNASSLRTRQPLAPARRVPDEAASRGRCARLAGIVLDELNVKELELLARDATLVTYRIKPNLPVIGKRYGKLIPAIRQYLAGADGAAIAAAVARGETQTFAIDGSDARDRADGLARRERVGRGLRVREEGGYLVGLDTSLDDELRREGLARSSCRQDARKQAGPRGPRSRNQHHGQIMAQLRSNAADGAVSGLAGPGIFVHSRMPNGADCILTAKPIADRGAEGERRNPGQDDPDAADVLDLDSWPGTDTSLGSPDSPEPGTRPCPGTLRRS